jgi:two-component system OmpR family sensor kinase
MMSIRRELLTWLTGGLVVVVIVAAIATYVRAKDEANELFDYQLQQMAASLTGMPLLPGAPPGSAGLAGADTLVVQVWDREGVQVYLSQPQQKLPQRAKLGFATVAGDDGDWRVFSTLARDQVIQVAQPMRARAELAASMALRTIIPLLAALPFLALLVWYTIGRGMRPLDRVTDAVGRRTPLQLDPLDDHRLPREVVPLVEALNGLLGRLRHALDAQRAFIADAAHELRTPLTAVHLQAQLVERAATEAERRAALADLKAGLHRATHLVEQLLTLAREEPGLNHRPRAPVNLATLAASVVRDLVPLAAARDIDIGLVEPAASARPVVVDGDAAGLRTLLVNLVDNAIRYTPIGGRIEIGVDRRDGRAELTVRDDGPGIAAAERARVFDRFYRAPEATTVTGSGLGLAIVKRIADRHDADVTLGPGLVDPRGEGLGVTVVFPGANP